MLAFGNSSDDQTGSARTESLQSSGSGQKQSKASLDRGGRWLSINAACEILGVDKSTLRRWSDRGRLPVFRTPGGHRRYSEDDLRAFLAGELNQQRRVNRRELAAITREEFRRSKPESTIESFVASICDEVQNDELRHTCDRMLDLSVRYASGRGNADRLLVEACEVANEFGRYTARAHLETSQAAETFLCFRRPLLDALGRYVEQQNMPLRRSCRMIGKLNAYLDVVLMSVIEAHEAYSEA